MDMKQLMVICLIVVFAAQSCTGTSDMKRIHTEKMSVESFNGIKISRFLNAKVVKGDEYSVKISVPERYADSVSVSIDAENNLRVRLQREDAKKPMKRSEKFEVEITCPAFDRVFAEDGSGIEVMPGFAFENVELNAHALAAISIKEWVKVENSCKIDARDLSKVQLNVETENLEVKSGSLSSVTLVGTVANLNASASDMSKINSRKLTAKIVHAKAGDMSEIFVHADEKLELEASDMSRIRYTGAGEVEKNHCEGMSTIRKK